MRITAKPTQYGGVEFRSRLEARFAEMLHRQLIEYDYEPDNCGFFGNYQPDFYLPMLGPRGLFIEIKPRAFLGELEMFWNNIWQSEMPWICVDKADTWRGGWVMLQANARFRGNLRFTPSPVPIIFRRDDTLQYLELSAFQIVFAR